MVQNQGIADGEQSSSAAAAATISSSFTRASEIEASQTPPAESSCRRGTKRQLLHSNVDVQMVDLKEEDQGGGEGRARAGPARPETDPTVAEVFKKLPKQMSMQAAKAATNLRRDIQLLQKTNSKLEKLGECITEINRKKIPAGFPRSPTLPFGIATQRVVDTAQEVKVIVPEGATCIEAIETLHFAYIQARAVFEQKATELNKKALKAATRCSSFIERCSERVDSHQRAVAALDLDDEPEEGNVFHEEMRSRAQELWSKIVHEEAAKREKELKTAEIKQEKMQKVRDKLAQHSPGEWLQFAIDQRIKEVVQLKAPTTSPATGGQELKEQLTNIVFDPSKGVETKNGSSPPKGGAQFSKKTQKGKGKGRGRSPFKGSPKGKGKGRENPQPKGASKGRPKGKGKGKKGSASSSQPKGKGKGKSKDKGKAK